MADSYLVRNGNINVNALTRGIVSAIETGLHNAAVTTSRQVAKMINASTSGAFNTAVKEFYSDPHFSLSTPGYERTYSMYDMLVTEEREYDGIIQPWYGFDDSRMSTFRNPGSSESNGLFDQVFVKGWHGGADRISPDKVKRPFQAHPSPGVPYYRKPTPYYKYWGRRAVILKPSPMERFEEYRKKAIDQNYPAMQKLYNKNVDEEIAKEITKMVRRWQYGNT